MPTCTYDEAYRGECGDRAIPFTDPPRCYDHRDKQCVVCGDVATHGCTHTGGLVCGAPLCDDHDLNDCTWHG